LICEKKQNYSELSMVHAPAFLQKLTSKQKKEVVTSIVLIVLVLGGTFGAMVLMKVILRTDYPIVVVTSGSMEPTIYRGDILVLEGKDPADIAIGTHADRLGDIILYDSHGIWPNPIEEPIVHRVVGYTYNATTDFYYFITQGDANGHADPPVPETHVLGVVRYILPKVGMVKLWLDTPGLSAFLIGGLGILLVISIIQDIRHPDEDDEKEEKAKQKKENLPSPEHSPLLSSEAKDNIDLGL
jgi:signal peptidase